MHSGLIACGGGDGPFHLLAGSDAVQPDYNKKMTLKLVFIYIYIYIYIYLTF